MLPHLKTSINWAIKLRLDDAVYYRQLAFQFRSDPKTAERCFAYDSQVYLSTNTPSVTTVVHLFPPGPKEGSNAYRVVVGGRERNVWHFGEVRIWEVAVDEILSGGAPGLLALVPLMAGGDNIEAIDRAATGIDDAIPKQGRADTRALLFYFARARAMARMCSPASSGRR